MRIMLAGLAGLAATLTVAAPASAVPGLVVTTAVSPDTGSEGFKGADAVCPTGTKILGGGATIGARSHGVQLAGVNTAPLGLPADSAWVTANEGVGGFGSPWTLTGWAICASGVSGFQLVTAQADAPGSSTLASATATCPAGKQVLGAGGRSNGKPHVVLDTIMIASDLHSVTVEVFGLDGMTPTAYAYASCADPVPGAQLVTVSTPYDSSDKSLSVDCPAGKKLHGIGGGLTGAAGAATLYKLAPHGAGLTGGVDLIARETLAGTAGTWRADLQLVCVP